MDEDFRTAVLERLVRIETKLENGILGIQQDHEERLRKIEDYGDLKTIIGDFEKRIRTTERAGLILIGVLTAFEVLLNLQKIISFLK